MILNLHLLKKELSVPEYEEIISAKAPRYNQNWQRLPNYMVARCPICLAENTEKIDTYSLRRWFQKMAHGGSVSLSAFYSDLITHHCPHFSLVQTFFSFSEIPEEVKEASISKETVPYVIGHLLESELCKAVIHALPVCRIEGDEFIPGFTLFMISYFSLQSPDDVFQAVYRYNERYYRTWESSTTMYLPLELGKPYWADLSHWVSEGQLYWVDTSDPELSLKTHDVITFPYKGYN